MPIVGWSCSVCRNDKAPLDHYAKTVCGESIPADYVGAILRGRDDRYSKGEVTVTQGLSCPRRMAIEASEPTYPDPLSFNAMETGTAFHSHMEAGSVDPANTEVVVGGTVGGIALRGKVDRLLPPDTILDWKAKADTSRSKIKGAEPEHVAQLSIYAELVQQTQGWRPTKGVIAYHFHSAPAFIMAKVTIMAVGEALSLKPHGGDYSAAELYHQASEYYAGKPWADLPMAGKSMSFGRNSACDYCSVRDLCWIKEGGAPF